MVMQLLSSLWGGDSSAPTKQLVTHADTLLSANSVGVDKIKEASDQLRACYEAQKKAYPAFFQDLNAAEPKVCSEKEMSEELSLLITALMTDFSTESQELDKLSQISGLYDELIAVWTKIVEDLKVSRQHLGSAHELDKKNVADLTRVLKGLAALGVQPTCHGGSKSQ